MKLGTGSWVPGEICTQTALESRVSQNLEVAASISVATSNCLKPMETLHHARGWPMPAPRDHKNDISAGG